MARPIEPDTGPAMRPVLGAAAISAGTIATQGAALTVAPAPPGLALPFHGSHRLSLGFGPCTLNLEPAQYVQRSGGHPWACQATPFLGAPHFAHVHTGCDYAMPVGTPLYAMEAGTVILVDHSATAGLGIVVKIDGRQTWYYLGHLQSVRVGRGHHVSRGELIAHSGESGKVTGPHVHVQVEHAARSRAYNPARLIIGGDRADVDWTVPR